MARKHRGPGLLNTQFLTTLISTTLVLILLGTIVFFVLTAHNLSNYVKENINVEVLLKDGMTGSEVEKLQLSLEKKGYVKSIEYISKEDAAKEQIEAMGTDPSEFLGYNPFAASFEIYLNADYANNDSLVNIERALKGRKEVMDVIYQKELTDSINYNIGKLSMILLIIAALFAYISFALINNTVKLTIFSKRFTINTMKLVGASWGFIRKPFMHKAVFLGILSAIFADAVIVFGVDWMVKYEPSIATVIDTSVFVIVCGAVILLGLVITLLCTYFSLWKYLRMSSNDLYHI
ncbi:MAG: permease-like cell division protein FtsX [Bacteroidaceae bacterium]|nr:permease-like cell division protein FtsX [Bacteroidaceae bacterium]